MKFMCAVAACTVVAGLLGGCVTADLSPIKPTTVAKPQVPKTVVPAAAYWRDIANGVGRRIVARMDRLTDPRPSAVYIRQSAWPSAADRPYSAALAEALGKSGLQIATDATGLMQVGYRLLIVPEGTDAEIVVTSELAIPAGPAVVWTDLFYLKDGKVRHRPIGPS